VRLSARNSSVGWRDLRHGSALSQRSDDDRSSWRDKKMMIVRPKKAHADDGRHENCLNALEPRFLERLHGQAGRFIDREAIEVPLVTEATQAVWAQREISQTITKLANRHHRRTPAIPD